MIYRTSVLLVEDELAIAMLLEDVLEGTEFDVIGTTDCNPDAIHLMLSMHPELVVVDYALRDGPCLPLIAAIKEHWIPYLIISGYPTPPHEDVASAPWLGKPFTSQRLLTRMREVVLAHQAV